MARKRANGDGSIFRRSDGRWEGRYVAPTVDGGLKRRSVYGRTKAEVREKLDRAKAERDKGLVIDDQKTTFGEFLDLWLVSCVRGEVAESTYYRDKYLVEKHVKPHLGKWRLRDLKALHLQSLYARKKTEKLSGGTLRKIHQVIYRSLRHAERLDMIPRNPASLVKAPVENPKEMSPLSKQDSERFLEAAREDRLEALYYLAVCTGMRQGELLALKWEDVDLDVGSLGVRRNLMRVDNGRKSKVSKTKTKSSNRKIILPQLALEKLREHRTRQSEEKLRMGDLYRDEGFVFAGEPGNFINSSNLRNRSFKPLLKRSGVPKITFHDLRHTCASLLFQQGVHPKHVQHLLGHAKVSLTLDTYSHLLPEMGGEAAEAMNRALEVFFKPTGQEYAS